MQTFPEQLPHGKIRQIFPDVYFVKGQMNFQTPNAAIQLSRAMTIVRQGRELTLVNTVRLDDDGLQALDGLGAVRNIIRLGSSHGRDDAFYSDRYKVPVWAAKDTPHTRAVHAEETLRPGGAGPLANATVVLFETIPAQEAVLCLHRQGGILVSCDSLQNMTGPDEFVDPASAALLDKGGFFRRANIGPAWRARLQPDVSDYRRILDLEFRHLLPSHGDPLLNEAHSAVSDTVDRVFQA